MISHVCKRFMRLLAAISFVLVSASFAAPYDDGYLPIETDMISVFKNVSPYVINVNTRTKNSSFILPAWETLSEHSGSGFLWNDRGYVVTNYHVIKYGKKFSVTFSKDVTINARLIGFDKRNDIAVLRLTSTRKIPTSLKGSSIALGDSNQLQVGQLAIAIGHPYGLDKTLTTGVISALNRELPELDGISVKGMIQTDASVNPGNSGGPLLDSQGRLIGMNTLIVSRTGASSGIAFAIPVNTIKSVVSQLIRYGKVLRPGIGVNTLHEFLAAKANISGVVIESVVSNSPAAKSGLQGLYTKPDGSIGIRDVIVGIDKFRINDLKEYNYLMDKKKAGDSVLITYYREGRLRKATLKVINT